MRDEAGADSLADERAQIGCDGVHLVQEVRVQLQAVRICKCAESPITASRTPLLQVLRQLVLEHMQTPGLCQKGRSVGALTRQTLLCE